MDTEDVVELEQIQSPDVIDIDDTTEDGEPVCKKQKLEDVTQDEIRIVLVGKTGVGKSELANSLLGSPVFDAAAHMSSVTSSCSRQQQYIESIKSTLILIDTPRLFDTKTPNEDIVKCIKLSKPGPHIFIVVLSLTSKFTTEDQQTIDYIEKIFGKNSYEFMIVVVTNTQYADVKIDDTWVRHAGQEPLKPLLEKCKNRYSSIDNKGEKMNEDVESILKKIKRTIKQNNNNYYTGEMYQDSVTLYFKNQKQKEALKEKEKEIEKLKKENSDLQCKCKELKLQSGTIGRVRGPIKEPDRTTLKNNIPNLLEQITEPDRILESLCSKGVFDGEDREKVEREKKENGKRAGVKELLNLLLDCGRDALQLFKACLRENNYNEALELLGFNSN